MPTIVVDASVMLDALLPGDHQAETSAQFSTWIDARINLAAPSLWLAECTSGVRAAVYRGLLSAEAGRDLLSTLPDFPVQVYGLEMRHCHLALNWASRLGQVRAYNGFYLALAEEIGAELWTNDRRLFNGVRQLGVDWVRTIGGSGSQS